MNQQDQIDIIKAHMAGKQVLVNYDPVGNREDWVLLTTGHYNFDFQSEDYKIEPRKLELFMTLPSGVLQALGRESIAVTPVYVSNRPPETLRPGYVIVKIHCTELES